MRILIKKNTMKTQQKTGFEFTPNVAEVQLNWSSKIKASEREKVGSSADGFKILSAIWPDTIEYRESFFVLLLDRGNKVLGALKLSDGGCTGTVADPKMVFQAALLANAHAIILAHNHPSGNITPSNADINLTKKMKASGELLEIAVLDHLIITKERFYSFADEGMM